MPLYAVKALLEFHWGYSVKRPIFSAAQPALLVPPPTALLGALARAASYLRGWPEVVQDGSAMRSSASLLLGSVRWAALALVDERFAGPLLGPVETRDLTRALIAPYQRADNIYPGSPLLFGVQPHGKVYAPSMRAAALFLATDESVADYARCILSVGSKESLVSVDEVKLAEVKTARAAEVETRYYFPSDLGEVLPGSGGAGEGRAVRELLSLPDLSHYELARVKDLGANWREFVVPLGRVRVKLAEGAVAVLDPDGEAAVVPRRVVEGA
jgi:CRISPR-associated protein Cas5a/b/c